MDFASEWAAKNINQRKADLANMLANPHQLGLPDYLKIVEAADNWGVYASNGPNFKYAVFGRDSLVVADDLLATHKDLVYDIILVLAKLQGVTTNDDNEEEPGKIHHEFRQRQFNGEKIPEYSLGILNNLQRMWGNEGSDSMVYYGAYDSTPLYVRLVCKYVEYYGDAILRVGYVGRDTYL
jgi:glycogen debranching enzyme